MNLKSLTSSKKEPALHVNKAWQNADDDIM